jgi:hypothetical protein
MRIADFNRIQISMQPIAPATPGYWAMPVPFLIYQADPGNVLITIGLT